MWDCSFYVLLFGVRYGIVPFYVKLLLMSEVGLLPFYDKLLLGVSPGVRCGIVLFYVKLFSGVKCGIPFYVKSLSGVRCGINYSFFIYRCQMWDYSFLCKIALWCQLWDYSFFSSSNYSLVSDVG